MLALMDVLVCQMMLRGLQDQPLTLQVVGYGCEVKLQSQLAAGVVVVARKVVVVLAVDFLAVVGNDQDILCKHHLQVDQNF